MEDFVWSREQNQCFGCGDNPIGLGLDFSFNGDWIVARTKLGNLYQGFQNSAHGGIIATLLDEASTWAAMAKTKHISPSYKLNCKFLKPVPLEEDIIVRAMAIEENHGVVKSKSEIKDNNGKLLANGKVSCRVLEKEVDIDEGELIT